MFLLNDIYYKRAGPARGRMSFPVVTSHGVELRQKGNRPAAVHVSEVPADRMYPHPPAADPHQPRDPQRSPPRVPRAHERTSQSHQQGRSVCLGLTEQGKATLRHTSFSPAASRD